MSTRSGLFRAAVVGALISLFQPAMGAAPATMAYQGYLTSSAGTPVNGTVAIAFRLYAAATGGTAIWTETQNVPVANGLYSVVLGAASSLAGLPFDQPYWLGVTIGTDAEMAPRQPLTSAPYAQTASRLAANGSNCPAGQFAQGVDAQGNAEGCAGFAGGGVVAVTASAPLASSGGATPNLSLTACTNGQVLKHNGTSWGCASAGTVSSITAGNGLTGGTITTAGTIAIDANSSTLTNAFHKQGGNSLGTTAILGTVDSQPLEIMVGNARIMRYDPATRSVVGGHANNRATANGVGAVIGGGGGLGTTCHDWQAQTDTRDCGNVADGVYNTIGGGFSNQVGHNASTVAGGWYNSATGQESTVGGGWNNRALHAWATVIGGVNNAASGIYSVVLGGGNNEATADHGIAAGWCARASHAGSFVWSDSMNYMDCKFASTAQNQFSVRATGGVRFVTAINSSSVPTKTFSIDSAGNATAEGTMVGKNGVRGEIGDYIAVYGINTSANAPAVEGWNMGTGDIIRAWAGPNGAQQLRLAANNNGNLWIGGTLTQASDGRLKTNIMPLDGALERVARLRGVRYTMKEGDRAPHIGVVAQELEQEYPELVATDAAGMKSVAYANLSAVLIEAVKALKAESAALKARLAAVEQTQRDELASLRAAVAALLAGQAPGPLARNEWSQ